MRWPQLRATLRASHQIVNSYARDARGACMHATHAESRIEFYLGVGCVASNRWPLNHVILHT